MNDSPITVTPAPGGYHLHFAYNADFVHDLKLIPWYARRWDKEKQAWWVKDVYMAGVTHFIYAHFGIDWTPRQPVPCIQSVEDFISENKNVETDAVLVHSTEPGIDQNKSAT